MMIEPKELYRPIHLQKQTEVVQGPRSVDLVIKKQNVIYRDPESLLLGSSHSKPEIGAQAISAAHESNAPISVAEKLLRELSNRVSVPLLFPLLPTRSRGVSQSIDSLSMPSLNKHEGPENKLKGIFDSVKVKAKALHENIMNNLRPQDRNASDLKPDSHRLSPSLETKPRQLLRPISLQRGVDALSIDDDVDVVGFRAILKRHKKSQMSHIQRMRGNLPSASSARPLRESVVYANNQEEV
jgi:hypothetical protein